MLLVSWHTVIGDIAVTVHFCNMIFSSRGNARLAYSVLCNFCVSTPSMVQKAFVQVITSASMICNLSHLKDRPRCTPSVLNINCPTRFMGICFSNSFSFFSSVSIAISVSRSSSDTKGYIVL